MSSLSLALEVSLDLLFSISSGSASTRTIALGIIAFTVHSGRPGRYPEGVSIDA